jgi:hypothetical protein
MLTWPIFPVAIRPAALRIDRFIPLNVTRDIQRLEPSSQATSMGKKRTRRATGTMIGGQTARKLEIPVPAPNTL